jgi:uncharacterized repeat protein (TIGR01451 family)
VTITVKARQPDLKLSLSEDDWVPGQNIAYLQVTVSNIGNATSTGSVVTMTLPAKKTFLEAQVDSGSDDGVCTVTGNTATCPLDALAPGAEPAVVEFAATLSVGSKVSASVKGNETEPSTTIKKLAW